MSDALITPPPPPPISRANYSKLNTSIWILFTITGVVGLLQALLAVIRGAQFMDLENGITTSKTEAAETTQNLVEAAIGLNMWLGAAIFVLLIIYTYRLVVKTRNSGFAVRMPNGLAIGAWFIPLANSILCFLFYVDIAKANLDNRQRGLLYLNLWWWLYLVGVHTIFFFEALVEDSRYYIDASYLSFAAAGTTLMAVASTFFAVLFFRQIRNFEAGLDKRIEIPLN